MMEPSGWANRFSQALTSDPARGFLANFIQLSLDTIENFENAGDYGSALKIARNGYMEALELGLDDDAIHFSLLIKRLETQFLSLGASRRLFDENLQPRVKLLQLLNLVGMEPLNPSESAVVQINDWAQKNLLRQGERWQQQSEQFEKLEHEIKPILCDLGFLEHSSAHFEDYEGAVIQGGLLLRVRLRLQHLIEQWEKGVHFTDLYFLTGERPLDPKQENEELLKYDEESPLSIREDWDVPQKFPRTEYEMIKFVWEQSEIPESMRDEVTVHFFSAPMKKDPKSEKLLRPTTDDTVDYWVKTAPQHGRYLNVTNAPYTNRQDLVLKGIAPAEYAFDTIGPEANHHEKIAIFLDELARFIFQTKQLSEK